MARHKSYGPADDSPVMIGDPGFVGVGFAASPERLPPRIAAFARNCRFRGPSGAQGSARTRRGVDKCVWGQRLALSEGTLYPLPWTDAHEIRPFRDPNGLEWLILASEERTWRLYPNNEPVPIPAPVTVWFGPPVRMIQAFGRLFCLRGNHRRSLVLQDMAAGWQYVWPTWSAAVDYSGTATVMWGPWTSEASGALTVSGTIATLTTASAHGLQNGSELSIRGTTLPAEYQGTFRIQVLDSRTLTFNHGGDGTASAAHALSWTTHKAGWKVATGENPAPGEEPGVSGKWVRDYTVLPNGIHGAFINGRLLVATSWAPGVTETEAADYGSKSDFLAVSDLSNLGRFTVRNEFRINQGSADELMAPERAGPRDVACFKGGTIHLLRNLSGDLSALSLDTLRSGYGLVNPRAVTQVGRDLVFVAPGRGICTLTQSATGEVQGVDVPLSAPIQPLIQRINWKMADRIRLGFWDNKLFCAVPLDDGSLVGASILLAEARTKGFPMSVSGRLVIGQEYEWIPGEDLLDALEVDGRRLNPEDGPQRFVYGGGAAWLQHLEPPVSGEPIDPQPLTADSTTVTADNTQLTVDNEFGLPTYPDGPLYVTQARIRPVRYGNNAVLVFDYELPATPGDDSAWRGFHPSGQWSGMDDGPEMSIREFVLYTVHGRERLLALTADGWLSLVENNDDGDWVRPGAPHINRQIQEPIHLELITRGYETDPSANIVGERVSVGLATWAPKYSLALLADGISEERTVRRRITKDRRRVTRPAWARRFDPEAAGARHDDPHREDYSVVVREPWTADTTEISADNTELTADLGAIGIDVGITGLVADRLQSLPERIALPYLPGRYLQLRITNEDGNLQCNSVLLETVTTEREEKGLN